MDEPRDPVAAAQSLPDPVEEWQALPDHERLVLGELVNRVLDKGVVITGELTISIGGVDLLYLGLQLILSSVETLEQAEHVRTHRLLPHKRPG